MNIYTCTYMYIYGEVLNMYIQRSIEHVHVYIYNNNYTHKLHKVLYLYNT